jgi:hypothetical protein
LGQAADGTVREIQPGEAVELPEWRARELVRTQAVTIEPDRAALAMRQAEEEHAQRERIKTAERIAAGPAPASTSPAVKRDAYGFPIPEPARETVRVEVRRAFCLHDGIDVQPGDTVELEVERALGLIARGTVVEAPGAQA